MARGHYELPPGRLRTYGPPRPRQTSSSTASPVSPSDSPPHSEQPFATPPVAADPSPTTASRPHVVVLSGSVSGETIQSALASQFSTSAAITLDCPQTEPELLDALSKHPDYVLATQPNVVQFSSPSVRSALAQWINNGGRILTDTAQLRNIRIGHIPGDHHSTDLMRCRLATAVEASQNGRGNVEEPS